MKDIQIAARYRGARVGGDFYDFFEVDGRLIFLLLDIAGKREQALNIAAIAQDEFRKTVAVLFGKPDLNEATALTELLIHLNRTILAAAGGVRCAPAFLGSYNETLGTLHYCNAGHPPALLRDSDGVVLLESGGIPLGLFSHNTQDAQFTVLRPGSALVLVSRGLVECKSGSKEFGLERVREVLTTLDTTDADEICRTMLAAVQEHSAKHSYFGPSIQIPGFSNDVSQNDITAIALVRRAAAAATAV